jgi:tetratricopeptide (TPR) repeat protein
MEMTICVLMTVLLSPGLDIDLVTASLHIETGMAYINQGLTEEAFSEFTTALEISEDAVDAHLGLARVAVINCSWETAESEYETYMSLRGNDYRAPLEMAEMLLLFRNRESDALSFAKTALSLAPLKGKCWMTMARTENRLGNVEEACNWYTRVIVDDALLADDARVGMGSLLFRQGDLPGAREILLPAAANDKSEAHHLLALVYMEQNDGLRASDSINRYLVLEPNGIWADSARVCLEEIGSGSMQNN